METEGWLVFFAEGVSVTAEAAVESARALSEMFESDRGQIRKEFGQATGSALLVHEALQKRPISTIRRLADETGLSVPTVTRMLKRLVAMDVVDEITGRQWKRTYAYRRYVALLDEGTEV